MGKSNENGWKAGLCIAETPVVLPTRGEPRPTWLKQGQAARLLRAAYHYHEVQKGLPPVGVRSRTSRAFILGGLYTGTRSGAICGAALEPTERKGWVDLEAASSIAEPSASAKPRNVKHQSGSRRGCYGICAAGTVLVFPDTT